MDVAIVTGASSALGIAISNRLIQLGFRVYGLGGDYSDCSLKNVNFKPLSCDLADADAVKEACGRILEKEKGVYVIVNNARYFGRDAFPEMAPADLERIIRINLLCPLIIAQTLQDSLINLQGYLIQLGTPSSESSRGGPAGAAVAGGLKWMGEAIFRDLREYGVKVCHLCPEPNRSRGPSAEVRPGARREASIDPEAVAQAVEQILQSPFGNIVTELVLRPLRLKEPEHDPVVRLPYPEPKPVPYTVPREMIEAEEQLDEEDWQKNQRRKRQRKRGKQGSREEGDSGKAQPRPAAREEAEKPEKPAEPAPAPRRKSRRKPKPPRAEVGFLDRVEAGKPAKEAPAKEAPVGEAPRKATGKAVKKAVARKAAKKTARKAAGKAAKKAVKKAAKKVSRKKAVKKTAAAKAEKP